MSDGTAAPSLPPIPVTVIGGYLGAGKTTLVNHLLRHASGLKLAVMVNDFGALPIDQDLIQSQDGNVLAIAGGCVCCSYGSDLVEALMDMSGRVPRPDAMIIETSGVALPGPVAASVTLVAGYEVDGVVVLTDAETVRERGGDRYLADTIERQLADANLVVLNKVDLVDAGELAETRTWIAARAAQARLIETTQSALPVEVVIGGRLGYEVPGGLRLDRHVLAPYVTRAIEISRPVDVPALAAGLADPSLGLIRAKGFVTGSDGQAYAIQAVGRRVDVWPAEPGKVPGLVVIGLRHEIDLPAVERVTGAAADSRASETAVEGRGGPSPPQEG